jgi:hypothetical protein
VPQQPSTAHLTKQVAVLGFAYKSLKDNCQNYLQEWALLPQSPTALARLPGIRATRHALPTGRQYRTRLVRLPPSEERVVR